MHPTSWTPDHAELPPPFCLVIDSTAAVILAVAIAGGADFHH
jgi:hypothetical protein